MSEGYKDATLENIDGGKALAQVNYQILQAIENALDLNTEPKKKRMVTLKISIEPNFDRTEAGVTCEVTSKLPADAPVSDVMYFGKNGAVIPDREQLKLDVDGEQINQTTGEVTKIVKGDKN